MKSFKKEPSLKVPLMILIWEIPMMMGISMKTTTRMTTIGNEHRPEKGVEERVVVRTVFLVLNATVLSQMKRRKTNIFNDTIPLKEK